MVKRQTKQFQRQGNVIQYAPPRKQMSILKDIGDVAANGCMDRAVRIEKRNVPGLRPVEPRLSAARGSIFRNPKVRE